MREFNTELHCHCDTFELILSGASNFTSVQHWKNNKQHREQIRDHKLNRRKYVAQVFHLKTFIK